MKRHSFRTINTLELHSLVYISLMLIVLLAFFLVLGNVGKIVSTANLDSGQADQAILSDALLNGPEKLLEKKQSISSGDDAASSFLGGNGEEKAALFGDAKILDSLASQLLIMEQSYERISSLDALDGFELLVLAGETVAEEDASRISEYVKKGGNVWFTNITPSMVKNPSIKELLGIQRAGKSTTWPGIRFSGDIALGKVMEEPKYEVTALELELSNDIKVYASALPKEYKKLENKDLPSLIWRYVPEDNAGSVYVCNGDFMDSEVLYFMLPTIFSELKGNYAYGILNAYCVFVENFPYAENENRESWQRLYSRDKLSIAQDLLSPQYLRYYTNYGSRVTYFSKDRDIFLNTQEKELKYYMDTISSSMALLALQEPQGMFLENAQEKLKISDWESGSAFTEDGKYCLPINFEYTIENDKEVNFNLLGSAVGLGYYALNNDVDNLLDYDGEKDVWDDYCKAQEVVFGIGMQQSGWLERVSAAQALERISSHLAADTQIHYGDNQIEIRTDAQKYWLILKGRTQKIEITGGRAEAIGDRVWLIEVDGGHAQIRFR